MKTKDFIKMLQEADPEGEGFIRMPEGIPKFAEAKAGYWDGPYSYIDEEGNWVYSTSGYKVDIYTEDIEDFVGDFVRTYGSTPWEEVREKFKFNLGYSIESQRKEREDRILERAKEAYEMHTGIHESFRIEGMARALENAEKGWIWYQDKDVDNPDLKPNMHHYYTWLVYNENGELQSSNPHNVEAVYKSGLFERKDSELVTGFYEWVLKTKK